MDTSSEVTPTEADADRAVGLLTFRLETQLLSWDRQLNRILGLAALSVVFTAGYVAALAAQASPGWIDWIGLVFVGVATLGFGWAARAAVRTGRLSTVPTPNAILATSVADDGAWKLAYALSDAIEANRKPLEDRAKLADTLLDVVGFQGLVFGLFSVLSILY